MRFTQFLFVETSIGGGFDEDGFKIPSKKDWVLLSDCRASVRNSGGLITTESGDFSKFSCLIYAPTGLKKIDEGVRVQVRNLRGEVIFTASVILFNESQKNSRIWV